MQPPSKPLRTIIEQLAESLNRAKSRGVSYDEITTLLKSRGVDITVETLKKYLQGANAGARPPARATVEAAAKALDGVEK